MVFYRKYRPKTIEELDIKSVRERLSSLLAGKSIPHAFLFSGPKGLGKTSSARILAREIHDTKLDSDTLEKITSGSHPDVLEIDAASNRGIDEMRELRSRISHSPLSLPKKVYIIDEVHMLTREAFNALLKTLEEPPDHVIFVLATTEPWKLPDTIISRTFHVEFQQPTRDEVVASLERIVKGEGLDIEDGVLDEVYLLSEGAFRDGAKILEELSIASGGEKITREILEKTYRTVGVNAEVESLLDKLFARDAKGALGVVGETVQSGMDMGIFCVKIVERLRGMLIASYTTSGKNSSLSISDYERLIKLFTEAYQNIKISPIPHLPIEMAVVGWCVDESRAQNTESVKKSEKISQDKNVETMAQKQRESESGRNLQKTHEGGDGDLLKELIENIDRENRMLAGVLRGVQLGEHGKESVEFLAKSTFHRDRIQESKASSLIQKKLHAITGKKMTLTVTITS